LQEIGIWLDIDFSKFLNDTPHIDWNFFLEHPPDSQTSSILCSPQ
jgi:hypothetical protein